MDYCAIDIIEVQKRKNVRITCWVYYWTWKSSEWFGRKQLKNPRTRLLGDFWPCNYEDFFGWLKMRVWNTQLLLSHKLKIMNFGLLMSFKFFVCEVLRKFAIFCDYVSVLWAKFVEFYVEIPISKIGKTFETNFWSVCSNFD